MTCAIGWIYGGSTFYDVLGSRAMNRDQSSKIPQSGGWEFADNLLWNHPGSKDKLGAKGAVPGVYVLEWRDGLHGEADHGAEGQVPDGEEGEGDYEDRECSMGEPTLLCKDMWNEGYGLRPCRV